MLMMTTIMMIQVTRLMMNTFNINVTSHFDLFQDSSVGIALLHALNSF
jgi:hypothetical protein